MGKAKKQNTDIDSILKDGRPTDIIIPIMGPIGAGKSTFVNALCGPDAATCTVGHDLNPCTTALKPVIISPPTGAGEGRRWVIVDTPGFAETYVDDSNILERISVWLTMSYGQNMKLAGVIYLHDISQPRMLGTIRKDFQVFYKLCGEDALSVIIPCTTKWDNVKRQVGEAHERELANTFWEMVIRKGSVPCQYLNNSESAWKIATYLLETKMNAAALRIRKRNPNLPLVLNPRATDLIIPIMGPAGVGKSTFVNVLCGRHVMEVGHGLTSCTKALTPIIIEPPDGPFKGRRLVIVDTPSFNNTSLSDVELSDVEILQRIALWLISCYHCHMRLAGVIYLFETSPLPMSKPNCRDREVFQKLCGSDALSAVVIGTTKWERLNNVDVEGCERILKDVFWEGTSDDRSAIHQFKENSFECAWKIINYLAHESINSTVLQIQRELVDTELINIRKRILDTEAGKRLYPLSERKPDHVNIFLYILVLLRRGRERKV